MDIRTPLRVEIYRGNGTFDMVFNDDEPILVIEDEEGLAIIEEILTNSIKSSLGVSKSCQYFALAYYMPNVLFADVVRLNIEYTYNLKGELNVRFTSNRMRDGFVSRFAPEDAIAFAEKYGELLHICR